MKYNIVSFMPGTAISGKKVEDGFTIITRSGKEFHGKKLIFAADITTGLTKPFRAL